MLDEIRSAGKRMCIEVEASRATGLNIACDVALRLAIGLNRRQFCCPELPDKLSMDNSSSGRHRFDISCKEMH
jgi:hypothetical protein